MSSGTRNARSKTPGDQVQELRIKPVDVDPFGFLKAEWLLQVTRDKIGRNGSIGEIQVRNFYPCNANSVTHRLSLLGETQESRIWRASFTPVSHQNTVAEVTAVENLVNASPQRNLDAVPATVKSVTDKESGTDTRHQRLFEAACDVINKKGYGAASMREIANAADLPIASMYQLIGAKEDLLFMITKGCMEQIFETFEQGLGNSGDPVHDLEVAISAYVDYIEKNRKYINLVYRETRSLNASNREKIFAIERAFAAKWRDILEDGVAHGVFQCKNTELTAHALYFLCTIWALRHWAVDQFDIDEVKTTLQRLALQGLAA